MCMPLTIAFVDAGSVLCCIILSPYTHTHTHIHTYNTGGSTYCAVACLALMNKLGPKGFPKQSREDLVMWLLNLQGNGYRGRVNKPPDTCYSFWVAASLTFLNGVCGSVFMCACVCVCLCVCVCVYTYVCA